MGFLFSLSQKLKMVDFVGYVANMTKGTNFGVLKGLSKRNTHKEFSNGTKNPRNRN